ncbi:MAG: hypothetical protein H7099_16450 [Gemmatimonadaceae bacterium]|nr:hypothetical protein [Gemmatimonadaceae bacterium]
MTSATARMAAVARLELRTQQREPLTALYVLVLGLLSMAFAAAGPVELVRGRGAVPRDAAWSLWLAATALTAFGQVITTMVAATVVLRDRADRVHELLIATQLTRREYLIGKLAAALLMLCGIYAVIPFGLVGGALLAGGQLSDALRGCVSPFVVLVMPTMLAVGALQFAAGVWSGRLWVIVGQGMVLIWLWSVCADAAASSRGSDVLAVLDPFGTAPILRATAMWTDAERSMRTMPFSGPLLANRVLWLLIGGGAAAAAIARVPRVARTRDATLPGAIDTAPPAFTVLPLVGIERISGCRSVLAIARYTMRWMLRDTGWRVLALLGAMNVSVHAYLDAVATHASSGVPLAQAVSVAAASALQTHARLFLILLATIYAAELVWREREERSAALFDVLPVRDAALVTGRIAGVVAAQGALIVLLGCASATGAVIGARSTLTIQPLAGTALDSVFAPFVLWMLLSLAVHVVVQQKVAAHLCCIAMWVFGVLTAQISALPGGGDRAGWRWLVYGALAVSVSWLGWVRGEPVSLAKRYRKTRQRVEFP